VKSGEWASNNDSPDKIVDEPMSGTPSDYRDIDSAADARDADCEAFYIPDKDGNGPGRWHFSQEYDKGMFPWPFFTAN
jgi:hypothetical protein